MEEILLLLASGDFVTGEIMSRALSISRMAVHKRIEQLRAGGIAIEARPKRGYRLQFPNDVLAAPLLRRGLSTAWAGQSLLCLPQVESTNQTLKQMAREGAPHGQAVLAETQASGRGRRGRDWASPPGMGLWMSLLVRPEKPPALAPALTMLTALALRDALEAALELRAGIKWPNDLILEGKKLAGILLEISADMDALDWVVIGVGVNVNQGQEDFSPELSDRATSLRLHLGQPVDRGPLLRAFLAAFEARYEQWLAGGFAALLPDYQQASLTLGRPVRVESPGQAFEGIARRVGEDGSLYVERPEGTLEQVWAGDVSVRGLMGYV